MVAPLDLARLCEVIYEENAQEAFDHFWFKDDVAVGHRRMGEVDILVFRGSKTAEDWARDADVLPVFHGSIGLVHEGFVTGMDVVLGETHGVVGGNVVITGFSLGGARARLLAALRLANHYPVSQLTVFGSPKAGFHKHVDIIQASRVFHTSYRYGDDPVPKLPLILPEWRHTEEWQQLGVCEGVGVDAGFGIEDHAIGQYVAALSL